LRSGISGALRTGWANDHGHVPGLASCRRRDHFSCRDGHVGADHISRPTRRISTAARNPRAAQHTRKRARASCPTFTGSAPRFAVYDLARPYHFEPLRAAEERARHRDISPIERKPSTSHAGQLGPGNAPADSFHPRSVKIAPTAPPIAHAGQPVPQLQFGTKQRQPRAGRPSSEDRHMTWKMINGDGACRWRAGGTAPNRAPPRRRCEPKARRQDREDAAAAGSVPRR